MPTVTQQPAQELTPFEVEDLVQEVYRVQDAAKAIQEKMGEDDALHQALVRVIEAQKAVDALKQPYQAQLDDLATQEQELRGRILSGWPIHEGKSIGPATIRVLTKVAPAKDPWESARGLADLLGWDVLQRVSKPPTFQGGDVQKAMELKPELKAFFLVREELSLSIRKQGAK